MVLGPQGPGRVGRRRSNVNEPRFGGARGCGRVPGRSLPRCRAGAERDGGRRSSRPLSRMPRRRDAGRGRHPAETRTRVPAGCRCRRSASQRQRRRAGSRRRSAVVASGVMQCCGRASTAPHPCRARGARGRAWCGWNARCPARSCGSGNGRSRSSAARARPSARCAARIGSCTLRARQNMCSYGAGTPGWNAQRRVLWPPGVPYLGSMEPDSAPSGATPLAERLFVVGVLRARARGLTRLHRQPRSSGRGCRPDCRHRDC